MTSDASGLAHELKGVADESRWVATQGDRSVDDLAERFRAMIEEEHIIARERRIRKVVLEVFPDNARAIALYLSTGFEIEGYKRDHYLRLDGSLRSAALMARFL